MTKIPVFMTHPLYLRSKLMSLNFNPIFYHTTNSINPYTENDILIVVSLFSLLDLRDKLSNEELKIAVVSCKEEILFFNRYLHIFEVYSKLQIKRGKFNIPIIDKNTIEKFDFKSNILLINENSLEILNNKKVLLHKVLNFVKGVALWKTT